MASHSNTWLWLAFLTAAAAFLVAGCDKGLGPIYEETGFEGTIFYSNWPSIDKVWELRLLAFENVPSDSASLTQLILSSAVSPGRVIMYPALGQTGLAKYVDSAHYQFTNTQSISLLRTYRYIALAWRYANYTPADPSPWRPAGVYTLDPATFEPAAITVRNRRFIEGVNIYVDFNNLPPKPWH